MADTWAADTARCEARRAGLRCVRNRHAAGKHSNRHGAEWATEPAVSTDPFVVLIGEIADLDGQPVRVGCDYDCVTIAAGGALIRLESLQADEFAAMFVRACWTAGSQAARMHAETMPEEGPS